MGDNRPPGRGIRPHPAEPPRGSGRDDLRRGNRQLSQSDSSDNDSMRIGLTYSGPAYDGEMSARELADVLGSLTDFVQAVSPDMGSTGPVEVKVKTFDRGSFTIQSVLEYLAATPGGPSVYMIGMGAAFRFYWKHMRKVVVSVEHIPDRNVVRVSWLGGEVGEITEREWRLYQNKRAKKAIRGLVQPLRSGAVSMQLTAGSDVVTVPATDVDMFEIPAAAMEEIHKFEVWAEPDTVSFDPEKKWRLTSRDLGSFTASIEDRHFLEDVATSRVTISKSDVFRLAVRIETSEVDGTLKRRVFIEKVIEHYRGALQDALPEAPEA